MATILSSGVTSMNGPGTSTEPDGQMSTSAINQSAENVFDSKQTDHRDELISRLRGQTVVVPDLDYIYNDWKPLVHPDVDALRKFLEKWIKT
jgi:hypothetical protein